MLGNYLRVALRNLIGSPAYSLISVLGLAVGLLALLLVGLFVRHEFSYDRGYPNAERIYQVLSEVEQEGPSSAWTAVSGPLAPFAEENLPDVEAAVRVAPKDIWVRVKDQTFRQVLVVTEPTFFDFFGLRVFNGRAPGVSEPRAVCLTASTATKLFGTVDPIGKVLSFEDDRHAGDYVVKGIISDPPRPTSLRMDLVVYGGEPDGAYHWDTWKWGGFSYVSVFLRLKRDASLACIEDAMHAELARNIDPEVAAKRRYHLQPLTERYLYSARDYGIKTTSFSVVGAQSGDIRHVQLSMSVACLVLGIACVNYVNLATARSLRRAREVGMRRAVGAGREQLVAQFLGESVIVALLALVVAVAATAVALPSFNGLVERDLMVNITGDAELVAAFLILAILTGLLAGGYPAAFLSRLDPAAVLKGSTGSVGKSRLRQGLVVTQFGIATAMLVSTYVAYGQMEFIQEKDLGFSHDQIVILPIFWHARNDPSWQPSGIPLKRRYQEVKQLALSHPNVLGAGVSRFYLQETTAHYNLLPDGHDRPSRVRTFSVGEDFFGVFDIPVIAGQPFSPEWAGSFERDRYRQGIAERWILNETAVRQFGWSPEEAVGKSLRWDMRNRPPMGEVIGVVEDFHIQTLHTPVEPVAFNTDQLNMKLLHLRVRGEGLAETIAHLEAVWDEYLPGRPFTIEFLDEKLASYYRSERQQTRIFQTFSAVAVLVACLGLTGLAAYTASQRTR